MEPESELILGWGVNRELEPLVAREGMGARRVTIPANRINKHTAIIAQSGSGKSFFVGRLIEEILLRTLSRCVILDPNGDFARISEIDHQTEWGEVPYDFRKRRGRITHEKEEAVFASPWNALNKRVRMAPAVAARMGADPLQVHWADVGAELVSPDYSPSHAHEIKDCHRITQALCSLFSIGQVAPDSDILRLTEGFLREGHEGGADDWIKLRFKEPEFTRNAFAQWLAHRGIETIRGRAKKCLEQGVQSEIKGKLQSLMRLHAHIPVEARN